MKKNVLLIPFVAVLTLLIFSVASAALTNDINTKFNGVTLTDNTLSTSNTMVGNVGDTVPLRVTFNATADASDVRIKVYMEGHRDDVSVRTSRFDIEAGVTYTKLLSLRLPSDADDLSESYTLYVEVVSRDDRDVAQYTVSMQRESYTLEVLSVDYNSRVEAGDILPVSVVVKNTGYNRMDDTYVIVSIPALGISTRGYVGDLVSTSEDLDNDEEDSMSKIVALMIPADVVSGVYEMEVVVYNDDAKTITGNLIAIDGIDSDSDDTTEVLDAESDSSVSTPVVALTVILAIVFVVLLVVLVILLTKKGKSIDEVETSYY